MVPGFDLASFLTKHKDSVIDEWVRRLSTEVGELYNRRPLDELYETVTQAFDSNYQVLVHDRYDDILSFINRITQMRLEAGFPLSHVQKAFELYRSVLIPLAAAETTTAQFLNLVQGVNACLAITIHRFSDHFQEMHQRRNLDYARRLEDEVRDRTAKLKESQSRYKTLVEEINDGYFVIQDRRIVFANQAFCNMHGFEMDDVLGRNFDHFIAPESRNRVLDVYWRSLNQKPTPRTLEYLRLTGDGRRIPTEFTSKMTDYQNRRSHIGLCRDISERVKMERRMREAERMADIGRITTSLSHEIRNPLSAVQLNLQILKKNLNLIGNDGRRLDIAVREVTRLEGILKELLDFAKPLLLQRIPFRYSDTIDACLDLLDLEFQQKELKVQKDIPSDLPDLVGDREKIEQAVINLLLNALDASQAGGLIHLIGKPRVWKGRAGLETSVIDEGPGVDPDKVWEVFKPFFTTKSKGTGLGLTIVRQVMEAHQGWVRVDQSRNSGAVFRIWLPWGNGDG